MKSEITISDSRVHKYAKRGELYSLIVPRISIIKPSLPPRDMSMIRNLAFRENQRVHPTYFRWINFATTVETRSLSNPFERILKFRHEGI